MIAIYNEIEPYAADWLGNLVDAGLIATGTVDRRSVTDLAPDDVAGRSFHAFAGIGVWSLALRHAGVPDDVPIWTGSCPCQPFSSAGRRGGTADDRHLWPAWFRLIRECRPPIVVGEQVASKDGLAWFDAVSADLEGAGYAVAAFDLPAAGVGAPHIRQRLYFVAYTDAPGFGIEWRDRLRAERDAPQRHHAHGLARCVRERGAMPDPEDFGRDPGRLGRSHGRSAIEPVGHGHDDCGLGDTDSPRVGRDTGSLPRPEASSDGGGILAWDQPDVAVAPGVDELANADESGWGEAVPARESIAGISGAPSGGPGRDNFWSPCDWIPCRDPQRGVVWRPVEPGAFPLVAGAPNRVGKLRAYGNAIVAPLAAAFIEEAISSILDLALAEVRPVVVEE